MTSDYDSEHKEEELVAEHKEKQSGWGEHSCSHSRNPLSILILQSENKRGVEECAISTTKVAKVAVNL